MQDDPRQAEQLQREAWRRGAEGWERRQGALRKKTAVVSQWLIDALDPQPGQRLLELAAGPGETGFLAAARLGSEGRLLSTDQSPEMLEVARRRAAELGLDNVDFATIDAQELDLEPGSFDGALCRWGYMLMGDPDRALRNTHRVLRPGGRLALATWATPDRNLWMVAPVIQLVSRGAMPMPDPSQPGPFAMPDPAAVGQQLEACGFASAETDRIDFSQTYASFDEYWEETIDMAAPVTAALRELDRSGQAEVRESVRQALFEFTAQDGRLEVPASAVVAVASA